MKKLQLYKHASDLAFQTLEVQDALSISQQCDKSFIDAQFNSKDYAYWKQSFNQCRQNFLMLSNQNAPSVPPVQRPSAVAQSQEPTK